MTGIKVDEKKKDKKILIEGVTESGKVFRPSNWAERMSGKMSTFPNRRITYSPLLQPIMKEGNKCILLDERLQESNPTLYNSILTFARNNNLKICDHDDTTKQDKD